MVQILQIHFGYESGIRGLLSKPCEAYPVLIVSNYSAFLMLSSIAQTWCEPYNCTIAPLINRFLGVTMSMRFKIPCILQPLKVNSAKLIQKGKFTVLFTWLGDWTFRQKHRNEKTPSLSTFTDVIYFHIHYISFKLAPNSLFLVPPRFAFWLCAIVVHWIAVRAEVECMKILSWGIWYCRDCRG